MPAPRRLLALALVGLAALAAPAAGCLSPTLPLPPPEAPDTIQEEGAGSWLVAGACTDHATVFVGDVKTGSGIFRACTHGSYAITVPAKKCDTGFVSEEIDGEMSAEAKFVFQEVSEGMPTGGPCE